MNPLETYIPPDRRWALARGEPLPDRATGAVLFADVSGFTPLTEALTLKLGARRGAEELTRELDLVYDALIAQIEAYGGSVITFAGDAALCWFGAAEDSADRAVACALSLQEMMELFRARARRDGITPALAIKVTVAYGEVRRLVVGDPEIRRIDVLAGGTVTRTATAEHFAHPGEILIDAATANRLAGRIELGEWRTPPRGDERFAVVRRLVGELHPAPLAPPPPLEPDLLRPWVHAAVRAHTEAGGDFFLTELRPVVALFARFQGIDFDADADAGAKLDRLVARAQQILARYDGTLLELTIGDKGSYFYAAFGAPHAHEDDARRAVLAARELFPLCVELGYLEPIQVGISQGVMRVGAYGGATRRVYGAQGDEANLAARLMTEAPPGALLVSAHVQKGIANEFDLEPLPPIRLKGKAEPLLPFVVQGPRETRIHQLQEAYYSLPMIGREAEFAHVQELLERARQGRGQVIGITAGAGLGKSRLTAEIARSVRRRGESSYGGECQSFGTNISYLVWVPIWRAFFGIDSNLPLRRQIRLLELGLQELAPARREALPLLGAVLNLPIPDDEFTRALEPEFRRSALHALLLECVQAAAEEVRAQGQLILFVVEDAHWIDPASRELLEQLAARLAALPVVLLLNYRPPEFDAERLPSLRNLPHFTEITLGELTDAQGEGLIRAKLAQHAPDSTAAIPGELIARITARAQGNPFYIEQLLDYLHDRGFNLRDPAALDAIEMPATLHRLILSRMDRLSENQQLTLKAASIIGRYFSLAHLCGYFPRIGAPAQVRAEMVLLQQYDFAVPAPAERSTGAEELAYLFKHVVTRQVAYEALPFATRAALHEAYAQFLETHEEVGRVLDLIAYHYDHSDNLPRRIEYLTRAGRAAAARFANVEAVDYFSRALALIPSTERAQRSELLAAREHVFDVQGARERQRADLGTLEQLAVELGDAARLLRVLLRQGWLAERLADHATAIQCVQRVTDELPTAALAAEARRELETDAALLWGVALWQQGSPLAAKPYFLRALELALESGDRAARARALSFLGTVHRELGEFAHARSNYAEQLQLAQALGDRRFQWSALNNLGLLAYTRGDLEAASANYTQGLQIVRDIADPLGEELLLSNLAIVALDQGEYERSRTYSRQALAVADSIGDRRSVCRIMLNLGETSRLTGDYAAAEADTQRALAAARELGDRHHEAGALMNLGAIVLDRGDVESARAWAEQALPIARETGHRDVEAFLLNTLGHAQLAAGELEPAQAHFVQALAIWQTLESSPYTLHAQAGLAELAQRRGAAHQALPHVQAILDYASAHPSQASDPAALAAYLTCYRVLRALNDPRAAAVLRNACAHLRERADKLGDPELRRSFLENVRAHRELEQACGEQNST